MNQRGSELADLHTGELFASANTQDASICSSHDDRGTRELVNHL